MYKCIMAFCWRSLNSVGVILAVLLIHFTGIQLFDPILSMVISIIILGVVIKLCVMLGWY